VSNYVDLTRTVAAHIRAANPKIIVAAHLSLRNTPPAVAAKAYSSLSGIVDGFLIAYPIYSEHKYSTAPNLEAFLQAVRPTAKP
jgi:hypothetical protein